MGGSNNIKKKREMRKDPGSIQSGEGMGNLISFQRIMRKMPPGDATRSTFKSTNRRRRVRA